MTHERWLDVMDKDAPLTEEEITAGWYLCPEWDSLLVGPGMGEFDYCLSKRLSPE